MIETIYLDARVKVNGKKSKIYNDNYFNLKEYIEQVADSAVTASNGMTEVSGDVQLGGTLTKNTEIAGGTYTLSTTSNNNTATQLGSILLPIFGGYEGWGAYVDGLGEINPTAAGIATTIDAGVAETVSYAYYNDGVATTVNSTVHDATNITTSSQESITGASSFITTSPTDITMTQNIGEKNIIFKLLDDNGSGFPGIYVEGLGSYATDGDAGIAGLTTGMLYITTSTGALTVKS